MQPETNRRRHWAAILLILAAVGSTASSGRAEWGTYQGDAAHTGYIPGTLDARNATLRWSTPVGTTPLGGLAVGGSTVFVTSGATSVSALDQASGSVLWSKSYSNIWSTSAPAYANGTVFFQTDGHSGIAGNYLHACAARTGASVFDIPYGAQWETYLNPTPYGNSIYTGGGYYGGMYRFDAATGATNWQSPIRQAWGWTPAVDGKYAYAYMGSGNTTPIKGVFTVLDLATGATVASVLHSDYTFSSSDGLNMNAAVVLGQHNNAFTLNRFGGRLVCWDTTIDATHTPHILWSQTGGFTEQPSLANGRLYAVANGSLRVLDELNGTQLWGWTPPSGSLTGPMIVTDNVLFATTYSTTYAVDLTSRSMIWSYPRGGSLALSDGMLYIAASDKAVYAFAVPEPATLALLALGGLLIVRRRAARVLPLLLAAGLLAGSANLASADVFNMGGTRNPVTGQWTGSASLEFVTVGDPGNAADTRIMANDGTTGYGSVDYTYQMGKYDVTAAQYCQFLNAVAKTDTYRLYNWYMDPYDNLGSRGFGITQSGSPGSYTYRVTGDPNFPMECVTWGDAARFCNWLSNGQPTGPQGSGTTETGSYTLNGATSTAGLMAVTRDPGATYVIPSEDEWYKAAYYKGGGTNAGYWLYPMQSNGQPSNVLSSTGTNNANFYYEMNGGFTDPTNYLTAVGAFAASPSAYGTFDQGGNVYQWNEANATIYGSYRGLRGGAFNDSSGVYGDGISLRASWRSCADPTFVVNRIGFRVVQVPEPTTLAVLAAGGLLIARRRA